MLFDGSDDYWLVIGAIAGWVASVIVKGTGAACLATTGMRGLLIRRRAVEPLASGHVRTEVPRGFGAPFAFRAFPVADWRQSRHLGVPYGQ
jgi:hypothetical protein